ncbi:MAG: tetratricopeptide repeat protein, partial [Bdellovibrionota bacterium]
GLAASIGCSSRWIVRSEPDGADVYVISGATGARAKIGLTPLDIGAWEIEEKLNGFSSGDFVEVQIERQGFELERIFVSSPRLGVSRTQIKARLAVAGREFPLKPRSNDLLKRIYAAQRFAELGEYELAQRELSIALEIEPKFSRAAAMRGHFYLAQGRIEESIRWYDEALRIDPGLDEAIRMASVSRKLLRGESNVEIPISVAPAVVPASVPAPIPKEPELSTAAPPPVEVVATPIEPENKPAEDATATASLPQDPVPPEEKRAPAATAEAPIDETSIDRDSNSLTGRTDEAGAAAMARPQ